MAGELEHALRAIAAPIFAASTGPDGTLFVHVAAPADQRRVKAAIAAALRGIRHSIRFHSAAALLAPRSLEQLVKRFTGDTVVYDPTGAVTRAKAMVEAAHATRASLGARVRGLFYAPRLRTLFVALDTKQVAAGDKIKVSALADVEQRVIAAVRSTFAGRLSDCPEVRVGFGIPAAELVAVDQRSVSGWSGRMFAAMRRYWRPVAIAALFGFGASAAAAKEPAVSQTNLKITGLRGSTDDGSSWFANGILTAPLGHSWGLQIEGGASDVDGDTTWGAAGHLFTRDPESYLLGLFAAYASENAFDLDATRVGAEAELYINQVSILLAAGYQFSDTVEDTAFGNIEVRWYVTDDFAVSAGGSFDDENSIGRAGVEWRPGFSALPGLAFRVDGAFGEDDYQSIMGGLTYYFGADASLKDRHRRQDPGSALNDLLSSVQQERDRLCAQYGC